MRQTNILIIPGRGNSGPGHWQSIVEENLPGTLRVQQENWDTPSLEAWARNIDHAVRKLDHRPLLVAHSFGCLAAAYAQNVLGTPAGASLFVAPADPERFGLPRWLVSFLPWTPVEAGIYRLNRVKKEAVGESGDVGCSPSNDEDFPETYVDYESSPREYSLNAVTTVLDIQTRVSDLYSHPIDQIQEQLRLIIEKVKEKQEYELVNNAEYGLLNNIAASQTIQTRKGRPTISTN